MRALKVIILFLTAATVIGCLRESFGNGGADDEEIPVEEISSGFQSQSMALSPSGIWIENIDQIEKLQSVFFGGESSDTPQKLASVNFATSELVLIHMGRKPSAGYRLALLSRTAKVRKGVARVSLKWIAPGKEMFTAAVVTSPFILIKLKKGAYQNIHIEDESGKIQLKLSQPEN